MTYSDLPMPGFRGRVVTSLSVLVVLLVFRVYLVPNTVPAWLDQSRDIQGYHFGLNHLYWTSIVLCILTIIVWATYYHLLSEHSYSVGLWLVTGAWLGITCVTILVTARNPQLVARESEFLLAYMSGLLAARLFRRLDIYITILIACGAIQSIIAIIFLSQGLHTIVSGSIVRAGGTLDTPSDLYLIPLFILPLAVQVIISKSRTRPSIFHMICSGSMLAALILTWERSGFLAVCIGLLWLTSKTLSNKNQVLRFVIVLLLFCGVFFVRSNGPVNYASSTRSIHSRAYLFKAGVEIFSHHILEGIGVGCLSLPVSTTIHGQTENIQMLQPYNQFLYWLDEMGIVGGVLAILFFIFIYNALSHSSSSIAPGVAAVWISIVIAGMFNTIFGFNTFSCGNMLIGSLLGITMRMSGAEEKNHAPVNS